MWNGRFLLALLLIILAIVLLRGSSFSSTNSKKEKPYVTPVLTSIEINGKARVKYPQDYTLVLVGDSMTEYLGNSDELRAYLKEYYPGRTFEVLNYGFGSTNILSVEKRLLENTFYTREFRPILDIAFDLILIESFGNNPLSEYPLKIGLKKQTEALDTIVQLIRQENPAAKIVFVATISPNKKVYAYRKVDLTDEQREKWVEERVAYIKNHIDFANSNGIPVVNVFEKSLNKDGDGNMEYISDTDYIHPSPKGVIFISKEIADFIYKNQILLPSMDSDHDKRIQSPLSYR